MCIIKQHHVSLKIIVLYILISSISTKHVLCNPPLLSTKFNILPLALFLLHALIKSPTLSMKVYYSIPSLANLEDTIVPSPPIDENTLINSHSCHYKIHEQPPLCHRKYNLFEFHPY